MKKLTKILGMFFALMTFAFAGCSNNSDDSSDSSAPYYTVECGRMQKSDYTTFMSSLGESQDFSFEQLKTTRDDFKASKTIEGSYEAPGKYSKKALTALLKRSLQSGLTPEGEIETVDLIGNNITFIDVTESWDYVTWVYIEKAK